MKTKVIITKDKIDLFEDDVYKGSGKVDGKIKPVLNEVITELSPTASDKGRDKFINFVNTACKLFKVEKITLETKE